MVEVEGRVSGCVRKWPMCVEESCGRDEVKCSIFVRFWGGVPFSGGYWRREGGKVERG